MHSQSANFGKFKLHSLNVTGILLHDSVVCLPHGKNQLASASGRFPPTFTHPGSSSIQKIKCLKENDCFFNRWCKNMGSQLKRCDALHFGRARNKKTSHSRNLAPLYMNLSVDSNAMTLSATAPHHVFVDNTYVALENAI